MNERGSRRSGSLTCPVCSTALIRPVEATGGDRGRIDCPRCGLFELSGTAGAMLSSYAWNSMRRAVISHKVRLACDKGQVPLVTSDLLDRVRDGIYVLPSPVQQAENALNLVARHVTETGGSLDRTDDAFCARIGALTPDRAAVIVRDLVACGWLRAVDASSFDGLAFLSIEPTFEGWEKHQELAARQTPDTTANGRPTGSRPLAIFVGYRRADTADVAGRIYDRLEERFGADRVFKDVDSIPIGTTFRDYVRAAINDCSVFLALIGPGWADAKRDSGGRRLDDPEDLVRIEIETALATDTVQLVPVLINEAVMPSPKQLPPSLQRICDLNAAHVRRDPDFRQDMDRLIRALDVEPRPARAGGRPPALRAPRQRAGNSKYRRLHDFLIAQQSTSLVSMSFTEIEKVIHSALPESAKRDRTWWANTRHPSRVQARAWLDAGYVVERVDFPGRSVVFVRGATNWSH